MWGVCLQLLSETLEQQKRCEQLTRQEQELRGQLSLYSEKFEEFQKTLTKSNEVFGTFKKEMDKVSPSLPPSLPLSLSTSYRLATRHIHLVDVFEACQIRGHCLRPHSIPLGLGL